MSEVLEFRPKSVRHKTFDLRAAATEAITAMLAAKPTAMVVIAADLSSPDGCFTVFTGGKVASEVNWLLDLAKQALLTGDLSQD